MKDATKKYDAMTRLLHWVSALIILWATATGFFVMLSNMDASLKVQIANFNVSITMIFIPIFCIRILHRIRAKTPPHHSTMTAIEKRMAAFMHLFLYLLVSFVLVTGVLMMDRPIDVFYIVQFPPILKDPDTIIVFKTLHRYATEVLAICIVMHIGALIKHEIKGRRILQRMI